VPSVKKHCLNLAADGLHAAIEDYLEEVASRSTHEKGRKEKDRNKKRARVGGGPPTRIMPLN
jgi:hypothetical protein